MSQLQSRRRLTRNALARAVRSAVGLEVLESRQLLSVTATSFQINANHTGVTTLTATEFESNYSDSGNVALSSVTITALPTHGTLNLTTGNVTAAVTASQVIADADLGGLTYTPTNPAFSSISGTLDTFSWTASDGTLSSNTANVSINITDNLPPTVSNFSKDMVPSTVLTPTTVDFAKTDFTNHFADADVDSNSVPDPLASITVVATPTHGSLKLNGVTLSGNSTIAASDLALLTYTPNAGFIGADSFTWNASDGIEASVGPANGTSTVQLNVDNLSVAGQTPTGNVTISNGDITPSTGDSTDFGADGTNTGRFVITRTYTITNNTGASINLTGLKPVTATGGNASDFVITQPGVATLGAGLSTTFTITFKPSGAGIRKTTISVASNITGDTPYKFAVQGRGVAVTTKADGLQVGTATAGTGTGANINDEIDITYSGTLLDGTPIANFDGSNAYVLGRTVTIPGWAEGLPGIKAGETRVLFIPAAQAFGSTVVNGVPANSMVIYTITATAINRPLVVLKGNGGLSIAAGDTTPSLADGTNLGTTAIAGNGTLSTTFHINDGTSTVLNYVGTAVTLSGSGKDSFTVSQPATPNGGFSSDFVVSFNPTGAHGFKTATVTVHTNDPVHPLYTFTVQAGFYLVDLVPSIGTTNFPVTPVISGSGKSVTLPVKITNNGADAVPAGLTTTIEVWAQPTVGDPVLVQTYVNQSVAGIGAGATKTINLTVTPQLGLVASGAYTLFAKVNTNSSITETNTSNDTSVPSSQSLTITQGAVDIQGNLVSTTLLPQVQTGTSLSGNVVIALKNVGNVLLPSTQKVDVTITLQGATHVFTKTFLAQSVGSLGATAKNLTLSISPGVLADDVYAISAQVTPSTTLPTEDSSNNQLTTTATGGTLSVTESPAFSAIGGSIGTVKLTQTPGVAFQPMTGTVAVTVKNTGNTKLSANQQVTIKVFARPVADDVNAGFELNGSIETKPYSIKSLAANGTMTFSIPVTLLDGLATAGTYDIEALVTPAPDISGGVRVQADAAGHAVPYVVNPVTNDVGVDHLLVASSLTKTRAASVNASGSISARVTNNGNVPIPVGDSITVTFIARRAGSEDIVLGAVTKLESLMKVGQQLTFSTTVSTANLGLTVGTYDIVATVAVTPSGFNDSNAVNDTTTEVFTMVLTA